MLTEPVYRLAEKEWNHFVESFTDVLAEVDPQIPHLPPKDVIHRIYRDVSISFQLPLLFMTSVFPRLTNRRLIDTIQ